MRGRCMRTITYACEVRDLSARAARVRCRAHGRAARDLRVDVLYALCSWAAVPVGCVWAVGGAPRRRRARKPHLITSSRR
eukprot:460965-Prymnesium_polylepis.1